MLRSMVTVTLAASLCLRRRRIILAREAKLKQQDVSAGDAQRIGASFSS